MTQPIEGFYGKPWTHPQRRELFRRYVNLRILTLCSMQFMGMNSYLYAPKDDIKHRTCWRELYTPEEETQLKALIDAADEHNVLFIFAISPGLDIVFSHKEDVERLKNKLAQVAKLGCKAFAMLFDDIEARLCPADLNAYRTPARAQADITNIVYRHLQSPATFLFCPTEYCATRASPSVANSDYLQTLGSDLEPNICVLWTGPLVVSKRIPTLGIRDLTRLLKRQLVLWDNLHANDFDQRRVFLGPYSGRPLALRRRKLLRGILLNPNCEFEANYVAMHTLAQWTRLAGPENASAIKMTLDMEDAGDDDAMAERMATISKEANLPLPIYRPREAFLLALKDWIALMHQDQQIQEELMETESAGAPEAMQIESVPTQESESAVGITLANLELFADLFYLPFEYGGTGMELLNLAFWLRKNAYYAFGPNSGEADSQDNPMTKEWREKFARYEALAESVTSVRDRFMRLPHAGVVYDLAPYLNDIQTAVTMTADFLRWLNGGAMALKTYAHLRRLVNWFSQGYAEMATSGEHEPWKFRGGLVVELHRLLPLEASQDLFPAVSRAGPDMLPPPIVPPLKNMAVENGAGGVDAPANDQTEQGLHNLHLFSEMSKPRPRYVVRPYRPSDRAAVYDLCKRQLLHRLQIPLDTFPDALQDLPGDRYLLSYLEHSPEHCLVVEGPPLSQPSRPSGDDLVEEANDIPDTIVGYALAAPDVAAWAKARHSTCVGRLWNRYKEQLASVSQATPQPPPTTTTTTTSAYEPVTAHSLAHSLIKWFEQNKTQSDTGVASSMAEITVSTAPPEPLGAGVPDTALMAPSLSTVNSVTSCICSTKPAPSAMELNSEPAVPSTVAAAASTAPATTAESESLSSSTATRQTNLCPPEAIYSALASHPASMVLEVDDTACWSLVVASGVPVSTATSLEAANTVASTVRDPLEHMSSELSRRLLVCLLASLKMVAVQGVHTELDEYNDARVELYRRFGFYTLPVSVMEKTTIVARMI